jgi:L-ascorbate metabolism protein UlaG (beta-lactamase superfamily)
MAQEPLEEKHRAELAARRKALVATYRESWAGMIRQWREPRSCDAVWLLYAGNYLFDTGGVRWAVDPVLLDNKLPEAPTLDVREDLSALRFVLLTHQHSDHVDVRLWNQLGSLDCHWVVPEHMASMFVSATSLPRDRCSVALPANAITIDEVRITPFASPHYGRNLFGEPTGVPSTGYLVEAGAGRYLLPGDVRTYDAAAVPAFGPVTAVFAHVFLGRSAALSANPPLLDAFVEFFRALHPKKVLLTHLYEMAREVAECWGEAQARQVQEAFGQLEPPLEAVIPEWYTETRL